MHINKQGTTRNIQNRKQKSYSVFWFHIAQLNKKKKTEEVNKTREKKKRKSNELWR